MSDDFINIPFGTATLDRYSQRTAIFNAIKENLPYFDGKLLDIGCGKMPYRQYIIANSTITSYTGLDIDTALVYDNNIRPDITWDGKTIPSAEKKYDTAIATEVLEHCAEPLQVLNEANRVLREGGVFFFTVPYLWNLHEVPFDEYRYTPFSIKRLLTEAGFCDIEIKATGGWHASLAQMLGLWVRRAPIGNHKRTVLSFMVKPIIAYLLKKDKIMPVAFDEGQMITGLYGVAYKK